MSTSSTPLTPRTEELNVPGDHRLRHENMAFDIDAWYPLLKEITFPTYFIPLEREDAFAICHYYSSRYLSRPFWIDNKPFSDSDIARISLLEQKIQAIINSNPNMMKNGAFIRILNRSPKDGDPISWTKITGRYNEELSRNQALGYETTNINSKLLALHNVRWWNARTGEEAVNLLLTSERIFSDMRDWVVNGGWEQIVLREWEPRWDYEREFRLFVYNGKPTALTQYDHYCFYEHLQKEKQEIENRLLKFFHADVEPRMMGVKNYAVDLGDLKDSVVWIELSPFLDCTGTAMFKWYEKEDNKTWHSGPFEFRWQSQTYPNIEELFESAWESRWGKELFPYKHYYTTLLDPSWGNWFNSWYKYLIDVYYGKERKLLFVYNELKTGLTWNKKYLGTALFKGQGITVNKMSMVLNGDNVPVLSARMKTEEKCMNIMGEVWEVSVDALEDIDYYMKFNGMKRSSCLVKYGDSIAEVMIHTVDEGDDDSVNNELDVKECISCYTENNGVNEYNAINHVMKREERYLGYSINDGVSMKKAVK